MDLPNSLNSHLRSHLNLFSQVLPLCNFSSSWDLGLGYTIFPIFFDFLFFFRFFLENFLLFTFFLLVLQIKKTCKSSSIALKPPS